MSPAGAIFRGPGEPLNGSNLTTERSCYFSLDGDEKWTIRVAKEECS